MTIFCVSNDDIELDDMHIHHGDILALHHVEQIIAQCGTIDCVFCTEEELQNTIERVRIK